MRLREPAAKPLRQWHAGHGKMRAAAIGVAVLAVAHAGRSAEAQSAPVAAAPNAPDPTDGTSKEPSAQQVPGEWYGWQTLAVDGLALGAGIAAAATLEFPPRERPSAAGVIASTWYGLGALAAPSVHYAHGRTGVGVGDFGVRLVLPPTVGFAGWLAACTARRHFDTDCARSGWTAGSLVGLAGAAALDAGVLASPRAFDQDDAGGTWYGWQTFAIDATGVGLGASLALSSPRTGEGEKIHPALPTWAIGLTIGLFGGPIVHFAHGRWGTGLISLGARFLVGPLGAAPGAIGYCAATGGVHDCAAVGAQWGLLGGLVAVSLFDGLVLANEPAEEKAASSVTLYLGPGTIGVTGYLP